MNSYRYFKTSPCTRGRARKGYSYGADAGAR